MKKTALLFTFTLDLIGCSCTKPPRSRSLRGRDHTIYAVKKSPPIANTVAAVSLAASDHATASIEDEPRGKSLLESWGTTFFPTDSYLLLIFA